MARGWESKAVEGQMEEAEERAAQRPQQSAANSPAARAQLERLEALRLSHARTVNQLKTARSPAHRAMLESARAHLEAQIAELTPKEG